MSGSSEVVPGVRLETDLRLIREAQGLSINDIHWRTKIQPRVLQEFEHTGLQDNPIYANQTNRWAFVKSYAESLDVSTEDAYSAFRSSQAGSYHGELAAKYLTVGSSEFMPRLTGQKIAKPKAPAKSKPVAEAEDPAPPASKKTSAAPQSEKPVDANQLERPAKTTPDKAAREPEMAPRRPAPPLPAQDHLEHWADLFGTVTLPEPTPRYSSSADDDALADVKAISDHEDPPIQFENPSVWTTPTSDDDFVDSSDWLPAVAPDWPPKKDGVAKPNVDAIPTVGMPSTFAVPAGTASDRVLLASTAAGASQASGFNWTRSAQARIEKDKNRRNFIYGIVGIVVIGVITSLYLILQPFKSASPSFAEQRLVDVTLEELPEQFSGFIREDPEDPKFITIAIRQIDSVGRQFTYTMWSMEDGKMYTRNGIGDFNPVDGQLRLWNQYGWGGIYKNAQGTFILRSLEPKQYPNWELTGG